MLSGVIVAAALAAVVEHSILGSNPVFFVPRLQSYTLAKSSSLFWYALLGLLAAIVSVAFTDSLLWLRKWFRSLSNVPPWVRPAIGGRSYGKPCRGCVLFFSLERYRRQSLSPLTLALLGGLRSQRWSFCASSSWPPPSRRTPARLRRHLCAGSVHGRHAGRRGRLPRCDGLPSPGRFHRRLRRGGMGAVFAGIVRAPMTSILSFRDDRRLRAGAAPDDRQHERVCPWRGTGGTPQSTRRYCSRTDLLMNFTNRTVPKRRENPPLSR